MMQEEAFEVGGAPQSMASMEGTDWNAGYPLTFQTHLIDTLCEISG